MTGDDERSDGTKHARENVIHEVGLFQARYGFDKAVILLQEGCEGFSNLDGRLYISFRKGHVEDSFYRILLFFSIALDKMSPSVESSGTGMKQNGQFCFIGCCTKDPF